MEKAAFLQRCIGSRTFHAVPWELAEGASASGHGLPSGRDQSSGARSRSMQRDGAKQSQARN
eukprot:2867312-Prymnesium_polylepis.1